MVEEERGVGQMYSQNELEKPERARTYTWVERPVEIG